MDWPTSATISFLGVGGIIATANVLKGRKVCAQHAPLMSDWASMKHAMMLIATYITKQATQEGRDLVKEVMELIMTKERS